MEIFPINEAEMGIISAYVLHRAAVSIEWDNTQSY